MRGGRAPGAEGGGPSRIAAVDPPPHGPPNAGTDGPVRDANGAAGRAGGAAADRDRVTGRVPRLPRKK